MKCTIKEQENCNKEKMGCSGCAYNEKSADEMNEEEKKAIEQLNNLDFGLERIGCNRCLYQEREDCMGCYENIIKTVLNLIEKQQKEITEKEQLINDMRKFLLKTNMMCDFLEWRNKDE